MKPMLRSGIAVFHPQGFVDSTASPNIISMADYTFVLEKDVDGVLVSLANVISFNKNGIETLVRSLEKLRERKKVLVGFCDCNEIKSRLIQNLFPDGMTFCLFETFEVATLFCGFPRIKSGNGILVWHPEKSQRNKIVFELFSRGYNAISTNSKEEYAEKWNDEGGRFACGIQLSHLGHSQERLPSYVHGDMVIYSLNEYVDNDINDQFDIRYHQKSLRVGFKLFVFDSTSVASMNIHGIRFITKLSVSAAEYGATICLAGLRADAVHQTFREELQDAGVLLYGEMEKLLKDKEIQKEYGGGSMVNQKDKRQINKPLISRLPVFIDAAIYTINTLTNCAPVKDSVEITTLKIGDRVDDLVASSIGFYGELDGMVTLIFSKEMALKACEILLGQTEVDDDVIRDALSELVNIVGGRTKTMLAEHKIDITITLPRTFEVVEDLARTLEGKKGVQVGMRFGDQPFCYFLTR